MTSPARKISSVPAPQPDRVSDESAIELYYWMSLTRGVEERALNLYRQGKLPGSYYTGRGQEAIAVGIALPLRRGESGDWLSPWIRDLGSYLVHGVPPWRIFAQFMGKAGSTTRGKDGNLHIGGREWNIPCQVSHMADMIPLTVGAALAYKQRGEDRVAVTSFGDAATSRGRLPRGPEHRGGARGAGRVRGREQRLGLLDADLEADQGDRALPQGRLVRHPGGVGRRQRRVRRPRRGAGRGRRRPRRPAGRSSSSAAPTAWAATPRTTSTRATCRWRCSPSGRTRIRSSGSRTSSSRSARCPRASSRRCATGSGRRSREAVELAERDGYPDASEAHEGVFADEAP